jgi:methyl-accepting chemotaxis protein
MIGLPTALATTLLVCFCAGRLVTRLVVAAALMTLAALHIHEGRGVIEFHFGIFVLMSFLLAYRDWKPILCAALVIAVHHLAFNYLQSLGFNVYCFVQPSFIMVLVHAAYVVAQAALLFYIAHNMKKDAQSGFELEQLSENLSRDEGHFDLRFPSMALEGKSSRTFKQTLDAIHATMNEIVKTIQGMAASSHHIAAGNRELTEQVGVRAEALRQTDAALTQIASRVRDCASQASNANELARQTSQMVTLSGRNVSDVAGKMSEIGSAVHGMSDMIATIEGIAFQTNILALNASVEAARAGEQGRGFSVVASEVRTLALRSATAAREIKTLILNSQQCADDGSALAARAGESMRDVARHVETVVALVGQISEASEAQSRELDQCSEGISRVDAMLGQDVVHVQDVASASGDLQTQAQSLRDAMAIFRISQSLPPQAVLS